MKVVFWLLADRRASYDVFSIMITNTCFNGGTPGGGSLRLEPLTGPALAAIGTTTAPRTNATATTPAQAGSRNRRRAESHDHIFRVIKRTSQFAREGCETSR